MSYNEVLHALLQKRAAQKLEAKLKSEQILPRDLFKCLGLWLDPLSYNRCSCTCKAWMCALVSYQTRFLRYPEYSFPQQEYIQSCWFINDQILVLRKAHSLRTLQFWIHDQAPFPQGEWKSVTCLDIGDTPSNHITVSPTCVFILDLTRKKFFIRDVKDGTSISVSSISDQVCARFSEPAWKLVNNGTHLFFVSLNQIYWDSITAEATFEQRLSLSAYHRNVSVPFLVDCSENGILAFCIPSQQAMWLFRLGTKQHHLYRWKEFSHEILSKVTALTCGTQFIILRLTHSLVILSHNGEWTSFTKFHHPFARSTLSVLSFSRKENPSASENWLVHTNFQDSPVPSLHFQKFAVYRRY